MPHPELHAVDGVDAGCGVEDFEGDELAGRVVVEDHAGPLFFALAHGRFLQDDPQRVGLGIVVDPHGVTPYLRNCVIAYTVTTTGGDTFSSMTIRKNTLGGGAETTPSAVLRKRPPTPFFQLLTPFFCYLYGFGLPSRSSIAFRTEGGNEA